MYGEQMTMGAAAPLKWMGWLWRSSRRFVGWWASLFLLLGSTTTCPCCGQQGCPGGWASAGVLGAFFAGMISLVRRIRNGFRHPKAEACHECIRSDEAHREHSSQ
jgi:hypothetical protein